MFRQDVSIRLQDHTLVQTQNTTMWMNKEGQFNMAVRALRDVRARVVRRSVVHYKLKLCLHDFIVAWN
jgi:hypothetical protein